MKKLLILNGSFSEATLIEEAKKLGYYVITTGNNPSLLGHKFADEYIEADYSDKQAILNIVKENNIDRIVSCANDFGVITASYISELLHIPGHDSYKNALLLHQKDLFKEYIQKMNFNCPYSRAFYNENDAINFVSKNDTVYPLIVKATDLTGGKGIMKAENSDEALIAIKNAFNRSRVKHIVIEPFIVGKQQSLVSFVINKKVVSSVTCDCFSPINPYLIQSELLPGWHSDEMKKKLHPIIESICNDLDLVDGILTVQYIIKDGEPYIIEMMRRCLGNQFLTVAGAITGFPWEEALIRAETGMDLSNLNIKKSEAKVAGHHGVMATKNGQVKGYKISPNVEKHIFKKIDILHDGDYLRDFLNERVAYIYYKYDNYDEAKLAVDNMNKNIKVDFYD